MHSALYILQTARGHQPLAAQPRDLNNLLKAASGLNNLMDSDLNIYLDPAPNQNLQSPPRSVYPPPPHT